MIKEEGLMSNPASFKNILSNYVPTLSCVADLIPNKNTTTIKKSKKFTLNFSEGVELEVGQSPWTGYFDNKNISEQNFLNFKYFIKSTVVFDSQIKGQICPKKNMICLKSNHPKICVTKIEYAQSKISKAIKKIFYLHAIQLDPKNNSKCLISFKKANNWFSKTKTICLDDLKRIHLLKEVENSSYFGVKCNNNQIEIAENKDSIDPIALINKTRSSFSSFPNCKKSIKHLIEIFILNNIEQNKIKCEQILKNPKILDCLFKKFAKEARKVSHCTDEIHEFIIYKQSTLLAKSLLTTYPDLLKILHNSSELFKYCANYELLPYFVKKLGLKHCIESLNCHVSPLALQLASKHKAAFQCNYRTTYQQLIHNYHGTKTLLILKKRKIFPFVLLPKPIIRMIDQMQAPHTNPSNLFYPILHDKTNCMQLFITAFNSEPKTIVVFPETTIEEIFYILEKQLNLSGNLLLKFSGAALLELHKTVAQYRLANSSLIRVVRPTF